MTCIDVVAEAVAGMCLARLEHLRENGVLTGEQIARIATRITKENRAVLGELKAATVVDFHGVSSDV